MAPGVARAATVAVAVAVAVARAATVAVAFEVAVAVAVNPRVMEPRPRCRNRIKKRPLSERSEFRTLPDFGAGDVGTRSEAEGSIFRGRLFLVTSFGEAKEVTRLPGRTPGLSPRQPGLNVSPVAGWCNGALF